MTIPALLTAVSLANLFLGFVVYARRSTGLLHFSFMVLTLAVAGWGIGIAAFLSPQVTTGLIHYINWYYAAALLIATGLYGFSDALQNPRKRHVRHSVAILGLPIAYVVMTFIQPDVVLSVDDQSRGVALKMVPYVIYGVIFTSIFAIACARLLRFAFGRSGRR